MQLGCLVLRLTTLRAHLGRDLESHVLLPKGLTEKSFANPIFGNNSCNSLYLTREGLTQKHAEHPIAMRLGFACLQL